MNAPQKHLKFLVTTGNRETVCNKLGISPQYLCDLLLGRRDISDKIGGLLGYERVWRKKK